MEFEWKKAVQETLGSESQESHMCTINVYLLLIKNALTDLSFLLFSYPCEFNNDDEEVPIFEEEEDYHEKSTTNKEEEEGPSEPIKSVVIPTKRKRPNLLKAALEDVEGHEVVKGTFRESKRLKIYYGYATYMKNLIEAEPYTFKEDTHQEVWKKVMQEEHQSIMKSGVWEIVP